MGSILPNFPDGRVGAGLLLLRLSAAATLLATPVLTAASARPWVATLLAICLVIGLWTRLVAVLCLGVMLFPLTRGAMPVEAAARILETSAILLLGSGAYSADALMFGRRTVVLGGSRN